MDRGRCCGRSCGRGHRGRRRFATFQPKSADIRRFRGELVNRITQSPSVVAALLGLVASFAAGCGGATSTEGLNVEASFALGVPRSARDEAVQVEGYLVDSCDSLEIPERPSDAIGSTFMLRGGTEGAPIAAPEPGEYGLYAVALNSNCALVAAGCDTVTIVADSEATLTVTMSAFSGEGCAAGEQCSIDTGDCIGPDGGTGGTGGTGGGDDTPFDENFSGGNPLSRFRLGLYHRDDIGFRQTQWPGDHNLSCGSSSTQRTIRRSEPDASFYLCDGHMHTSVGDTSGYSIGWFTPNRVFERRHHDTVSWSVSVTDLGRRQWWEVAVLPAGAPFLTTASWLSPAARIDPYDPSAIVVGSGPFGTDGSIVTNATLRDPLGFSTICGPGGIDPTGCASKDILRSFEITDNRDGTVSVSYFGETYTYPGVFPDQFEVYFTDHNFEPTKDATPAGYTWHWDDIGVR